MRFSSFCIIFDNKVEGTEAEEKPPPVAGSPEADDEGCDPPAQYAI